MGLSRGYICAIYTHDQNIHIIITDKNVKHQAILFKRYKALSRKNAQSRNLLSVVVGEAAVLRRLVRVLAEDQRYHKE